MSLTPCKECKQQVSTKARTCLHCGTRDPATPTTAQLIGGFVALGLVLSCGYWLLGLGSGSTDSSVALSVSRVITVTAAEYGENWPLTVDQGELQCKQPNQVLFSNGGVLYALNGMARNHMKNQGWQDINEIWQSSSSTEYALKIPISALINRGLQLCAEPALAPS